MTVLSAGLAIHEILKSNEAVANITRRIFPVMATRADLPYISYGRSELSTGITKSPSATDSADIIVECYTRTYVESVALAEVVRDALEGYRGTVAGIDLRVTALVNASEGYTGDAYFQTLTFRVRC